MRKHSILLALASIIPSTSLLGNFSLKNVSSFFGSTPYEEPFDKEYEIKNIQELVLNNLDGDITIKTEWQRDAICVKAVKRSNKEDDLAQIKMHDQQFVQEGKTQLTIETQCLVEKSRAAVDYTLIVPANIALNLTTQHGNISIHEVNGKIAARTHQGTITITNTSNTINANTEKSGNIMISQAQGNVHAETQNGHITIQDAHETIAAHAQKGNIAVACTTVPSTSNIVLETKSGHIHLALPNEVNAMLHGKTGRGKLTSDHYVTLKPQTTQLNNSAWNKYKKEVEGILGTGEADISVSSNNGNIKITKTETA